jgi:hypothetical protein
MGGHKTSESFYAMDDTGMRRFAVWPTIKNDTACFLFLPAVLFFPRPDYFQSENCSSISTSPFPFLKLEYSK